MITISVMELERPCYKGMGVFKEILGEREGISADDLLREAIERDVNSSFIIWGLVRFGEGVTDGSIMVWDMLNGQNWSRLLIEQPQFSEYCEWNKLSGLDWSWLLRKQPQFEKYCEWKKLDGYDWSCLLREQPQFEKYCEWNKLDRDDWKCLLKKQPQLVKHRGLCNRLWDRVLTILRIR